MRFMLLWKLASTTWPDAVITRSPLRMVLVLLRPEMLGKKASAFTVFSMSRRA